MQNFIFHSRAKAIIGLLLMLTSSISLGCANELNWKDFSFISLSSGDTGAIYLSRFSDAIYVKSKGGKTIKEMYQLHSGPILYRGLSESELNGPSPFMMIDMPVGIVLSFLAQQFKQPCEVPLTSTAFSYDLPLDNPLGAGAMQVHGTAIRSGETTITYELSAAEAKEQGAKFKLLGKMEFSVIRQLPDDTDISDWVVTLHGNISSPNRMIKANKVIHTVSDLKTPDTIKSSP